MHDGATLLVPVSVARPPEGDGYLLADLSRDRSRGEEELGFSRGRLFWISLLASTVSDFWWLQSVEWPVTGGKINSFYSHPTRTRCTWYQWRFKGLDRSPSSWKQTVRRVNDLYDAAGATCGQVETLENLFLHCPQLSASGRRLGAGAELEKSCGGCGTSS